MFNRSFYTSVVGFDGLHLGIFVRNLAWFSDCGFAFAVKGVLYWILHGYLGSKILITYAWILWKILCWGFDTSGGREASVSGP